MNSTKVMAVKEKITRFDEEKMLGYTLENMFLFYNPHIISQNGSVYRMEKCGNKKEREIVKRPYGVVIDAEYALNASMNPMDKKITLKKIKGPFRFTGTNAYGISHEMEHLSSNESTGDSIFEFEYELEE
ncbi:RimK/LysX family protein [Methanobacterium sp.]|uniref:RimK/LysX family protein n=1 Tax=Methanobacterium sp. TaxID=2164 RepID=UPI003D65A6B6